MVTLLLRTRLQGDALVGHSRGATALLVRNAYVHRSDVWVMLSGFAEPFLYLLSLGLGMGQLVGAIPYRGGEIDYAVFVAPAMLTAASMNGALTECTFNVFAKMKFMKLYDAVLATPVTPLGIALGEIGWALARSTTYAAFFLLIMAAMGLTLSWWAVLALPAALLVGLAFAAAGMAFTTYLRSWQDFDYITVVIFLLFLFSGTFAPLEAYPGWVQALVMATPLLHGVELVRGLTVGVISPGLLWHAGYLAVLTVVGLAVASRRMARLLTP